MAASQKCHGHKIMVTLEQRAPSNDQDVARTKVLKPRKGMFRQINYEFAAGQVPALPYSKIVEVCSCLLHNVYPAQDLQIEG